MKFLPYNNVVPHDVETFREILFLLILLLLAVLFVMHFIQSFKRHRENNFQNHTVYLEVLLRQQRIVCTSQ